MRALELVMSNTCTTLSLHRPAIIEGLQHIWDCKTQVQGPARSRCCTDLQHSLSHGSVWTLVGTDLRERLLRKFLSLSEPQGSMLAPPTQVCAQHKLQRFLAMLFSAECFQYRSARFCCITYLQNSTSVELCRNVHVQIPAVPNTMN